MFKKAESGRDAFTFSLRGMTAIASYTFPQAVADDRINKIRDARLRQVQEDQPGTVQEIENFLGRYFAPGCCQAA